MMTCVSLRSGMASSGTFFIDHQPWRQAAARSAKTKNLFLTEKSMIRLIIVVPSVTGYGLRVLRNGAANRGLCQSPKPEAQKTSASEGAVLVVGRGRLVRVTRRRLLELGLALVGAEEERLAPVLERLARRLRLGLVHVHSAD